MKKMSAKKFIISFISAVLSLAVLFSALTWAVDPFMQFRIKDNTYLLNGRFVNAGIVKNYDYDTLVLGSSMVQNFNTELMREKFGGKPVHIGVQALTAHQRDEILKLSYKKGGVKKYYIAFELYQFSGGGANSIPEYLLKDDAISKLKYCFSFESWFRYMPADIGLSIVKKAGINLPHSITKNTGIELLDNWSEDFTYGKDAVFKGYEDGTYTVSGVNTKGLRKMMIKNIDSFFGLLDYNEKEYVFFCPPYSAMYWSLAQKEGYIDDYIFAKEYFYKKASEKGISVYDFQGEDFTADLNNYKDTTHYRSEINDYMVNCISENKNVLNDENYRDYQNRILKNIDKFNSEYNF